MTNIIRFLAAGVALAMALTSAASAQRSNTFFRADRSGRSLGATASEFAAIYRRPVEVMRASIGQGVTWVLEPWRRSYR